MNDLYNCHGVIDSPLFSSATTTILICIARIEDLLDEEMRLLKRGALKELERINMRKSHLLVEFDRLSLDPTVGRSNELQLRMESCRRKARSNSETLEAYLSAMEELNRMILSHLRKEESDGTYSRLVSSHQRG